MSAPLILDPTAGSMTSDLKEVCSKFEKLTNMRIVVQERAGASIKYEAKAEPLRRQSCQREEFFACTTSGNGRCEKNGTGYRIECLTCQRAGRSAIY